jgi:Zn-dependent oligopeptidase
MNSYDYTKKAGIKPALRMILHLCNVSNQNVHSWFGSSNAARTVAKLARSLNGLDLAISVMEFKVSASCSFETMTSDNDLLEKLSNQITNDFI